jgi:hypothetical protein
MDVWRDYGESMQSLARTIRWIEVGFPDLRIQKPAAVNDVDALVFSFPVHIVGAGTSGRYSFVAGSLFLEPAFPTNHAAARGLAGIRVVGLANFGAVLEGGGIVATDGSGAFVGGGPALGDWTGTISIVARRYFVVGEDRWDFALDVTLPAFFRL